MKYIIRQAIFILFMCMPFSLANAQSETVTLDHVTNSFDDTLILANELVVFNMRVTNPLSGIQYNGVNNGFKIYSPNGATWDHTSGIFRSEFKAIPWGLVESILHFDDSSGNFVRTPGIGGETPGQLPAGGGDVFGLGPTAVQFAMASSSLENGLQPGFDDLAFQIEIQPDEFDIGLTICIDSTQRPLVATWKWASTGGVKTFPTWDGPHCFTISSVPIVPEVIDTADVFFMETADLDRDNYTDLIYTGNTAPGLFVAYGTPHDSLEEPVNILPGLTQAAIAIDFIDTAGAHFISKIDSTFDSIGNFCAKLALDTVTKRIPLLDIVVTTPNWTIILRNSNDTTKSNGHRFRGYFPPDSIANPGALSRGFSVAGLVPSVAVADFTGDQLLDIFSGPDAILAGDGDGNFNPNSTLSVMASTVSETDFDSDGFPDLLVVADNLASIYLNDGFGGFFLATSLPIGVANFELAGVNAISDIDRDGNVDFAVTTPNVDSSGQSIVTIAFGDGLGGIFTGDVISLTIDGIVYYLSLVDVDRDFNLDLVISNGTSQQLEVYRGRGDRTFHNPEIISVQEGSGFTFALTTADLNRDGNPDFISGTVDSGNLILGLNQLMDVGVLQDEMVVTVLDDASLRVINPDGYEISSDLSTVAGSDFYSLSIGGDPASLDDRTYDYNMIEGEYTIIVRPDAVGGGGGGSVFSAGIGINGSQQIVIADDISGEEFLGRGVDGMPIDSFIFYYTVQNNSPILPENGKETNSLQPVFMWGKLIDSLGLAETAVSYQFQLDPFYDFRAPRYDTVIVGNAFFSPSTPLSSDSIYYWRVRTFDGVVWSEYSRTFFAVIGPGCCSEFSGNVDCDGGVDIADLTTLIDHLFINFPTLCCVAEANIDDDECGLIDIADLTKLIDHLFIFFPQLGPCR